MSVGKVFLTGATGFVGAAIALELLDTTDATVLCLVRGRPDRVQARLREAAVAYGRPDLLSAIGKRAVSVPGDLTAAPDLPAGVDLMVHAAADVRFGRRDSDQLERVNVDGTRTLVQLAESANVGSLCYVSTAYVAGLRGGVIREDDQPGVHGFNNAYERSKAAAEQIVREAALPVRIVRPSIVVGHSRTAAATAFNGYYGVVQACMALGRQADGTVHLGLDPRGPVNLIPVDLVARAAVEIALSTTDATVFHLTNDRPPDLGLVFTSGFAQLGFRGPVFTDDPALVSPVERHLRLSHFGPYFRSNWLFDTTNTTTVCGPDVTESPMDAEAMGRYAAYFLERVDAGAVR